MKANREQLKEIIRELLIEVLSEGLGNVPRSTSARPVNGSVTEQRRTAPRRPSFDPRLDTPVAPGRQPSDALKEAVRREAGGNPVLADILADTAVTTLPTMLSNGDSGPSNGGASVSRDHLPTQQEQFHGAPEEVFGDGASRWADLAFMDAPGKKTA